MKKGIAKLIGYPAFVILGAVAVDSALPRFPFLFLLLIISYPLIIVLGAGDPAVYRLPFKFRLLVVAALAVAVCWIQIWPLNLGLMMAVGTMGLFDPEGPARSRRLRAWIRGLSHNA